MIKPVIVVCILGVVIGFLGGRAVNNDESRHQDEKTVVMHRQVSQRSAPHENLPSLVRAVEIVATGEVVSTQSFLQVTKSGLSGSPYSVHQFRVERCLKGDIEHTLGTNVIRLVQHTGPVPANIWVEDLELVGSLLDEGERYLVFVKKMRNVGKYTELRLSDYALVDSDSAIALRDGQVVPLQDWTPIAQMLETQQMSEEELIAVVSQAAEEAAPDTDQ